MGGRGSVWTRGKGSHLEKDSDWKCYSGNMESRAAPSKMESRHADLFMKAHRNAKPEIA